MRGNGRRPPTGSASQALVPEGSAPPGAPAPASLWCSTPRRSPIGRRSLDGRRRWRDGCFQSVKRVAYRAQNVHKRAAARKDTSGRGGQRGTSTKGRRRRALFELRRQTRRPRPLLPQVRGAELPPAADRRGLAFPRRVPDGLGSWLHGAGRRPGRGDLREPRGRFPGCCGPALRRLLGARRRASRFHAVAAGGGGGGHGPARLRRDRRLADQAPGSGRRRDDRPARQDGRGPGNRARRGSEPAEEAPTEPAAVPAPAPAALPEQAPIPEAPAPEAGPQAPTKLPPELPEEPTLPPITHVFLIVLGDQGYEQAFGPASPVEVPVEDARRQRRAARQLLRGRPERPGQRGRLAQRSGADAADGLELPRIHGRGARHRRPRRTGRRKRLRLPGRDDDPAGTVERRAAELEGLRRGHRQRARPGDDLPAALVCPQPIRSPFRGRATPTRPGATPSSTSTPWSTGPNAKKTTSASTRSRSISRTRRKRRPSPTSFPTPVTTGRKPLAFRNSPPALRPRSRSCAPSFRRSKPRTPSRPAA